MIYQKISLIKGERILVYGMLSLIQILLSNHQFSGIFHSKAFSESFNEGTLF